MSSDQEIFSKDLAGIVVGETAISDVQGEQGILSYRGTDINALVNQPFNRVAWRVLFGNEPSTKQEEQLSQFQYRHSHLSAGERALLEQLPASLHPMLMLQGMLPLTDLPLEQTLELELGLDAEHGLLLAAKTSALIAAHYRLANGQAILAPTEGLEFHQSFLTMFHGKQPTPEATRMLDAAQILQMEHSFNAGTFAGRVCASTQAPIQSAISASIGTLFGKLHGGADQAALEMAMAVGGPDNAEAYVTENLANKVKIMGMGHREYRTVDPRAKILKPMAEELCQNGESRVLLETLIAIEQACQRAFAKQGKEIWANVEFYKGAVFHSLGIPSRYFTALFAMARVYGYIAHFLEFSKDSRLIRPRAIYCAPSPFPEQAA
ncbi:MAG: citrate synthase [Alcanivorax sp.]|jgi:citrate synthase